MIVIDSKVANAMAEYQKKHGKRMSIKELKQIANVEEKEENKKQKTKNKIILISFFSGKSVL